MGWLRNLFGLAPKSKHAENKPTTRWLDKNTLEITEGDVVWVGYCTVWHNGRTGKRAGILTESRLCDIWWLADHERKFGTTDTNKGTKPIP